MQNEEIIGGGGGSEYLNKVWLRAENNYSVEWQKSK